MIGSRACVSRRAFLGFGALAFMAADGAASSLSPVAAQNDGRRNSDVPRVKALVFDTFGTVVDWRTSVTQEVEQFARQKALKINGEQFADAWRAGYAPAMNRVRTGELPWTKLDALHRMILDKLLVDFHINGLTEPEIDQLNRAWHRLRPWPDAVGGLTRLL